MREGSKKTPITASNTFSILGTYEGEALDTNITNKNGLDITDAVIDAVLESEDYKEGITNGWFIGYLGHPENPDCMDFERGCIVMTEMHRESNGKVYAKFNLVDTPVGQIVKKFQDAGVNFGISIRGAGDIINNSVDPDTFVFRGYDLVAFPAYPESIPKFTAIAASTNLEDRKKYQAVCASVKANIQSINSASTIDVLQSQFAPQSEEYKLLETRKQELNCSDGVDISLQKIEAMTDLYLETLDKCRVLATDVERLKRKESATVCASRRKIAAIERIMASQLNDTLDSLDAVMASSESLKRHNRIISSKLEYAKKQLSDAKNSNLIYKQKIESSAKELRKKDKVIASLQSELSETVTASSKVEADASNLGETNKNLRAELHQCRSQLRSYQDAYANLYASALGVNPGSLSITASTSVSDLKRLISSATNTSGIPSAVIVEPIYVEDDDVLDDDSIVVWQTN